VALPDSKSEWVRGALDRYEQRLVQYAASLLGDDERARDVVQDTFLRLCTAERNKVDGHLAPWLYTVCRNRAFDVRRKEGRMSAVDVQQLDAHAGNGRSPAADAARHEDEDSVLRVLAGLSEREQETIRLKFQHGMTYREISRITGMPISTVSHTVTRALRTLRTELQGQVNWAQNG
jgi:RNA polymerase sigma-70 factor (ECF subfamily)